ncbi:MAG: S8 family serine peptidase, partial [Promethearchaeota archaeon]
MQRVKHQNHRTIRAISTTLTISMFLMTILFSAYQLSLSSFQAHSDALPIESKLSEPLLKLLYSSEDSNLSIDAIAHLAEEADWKTTQRAILQTASRSRIKAYHKLIHAISFQTTVGELENIAGLPYIQKIWTDIQVQLDLPQTTLSTTIRAPNGYIHPKDTISATSLYDLGLNGSDTVVAILDTGIDTTHPDLDDMDDNETTNDPKVLAQVAFTEGDPFPFDLNGHGTYCAGLVAGTGFASGGNYTGIAPGSHLMSAKVLLGDGTGYSSWIIRGIEWSITNGADIILLPFSTFGLPGDPLSEAVRIATAQGVLVVCAAGDQGPNHLTIMSPGESLSALTVGAYDPVTGVVPDFSSRGPTFDFRTKPDVIAPGVDIISSSLYNILPTEIGNISIDLAPEDLDFLGGGSFGVQINENYTLASTTAASASIAAGAACLLLEGSRFATPEALGISIRKGARALGLGPNIEGTGLLNTSKAHDELTVLHNPFPAEFRTRSVGIGLPYYGMLISEAPGENVTLLLSGYSTAIGALVLSTITNMSLFHMLFGLFHLAVNDTDPIPFTFLDVEQEFHWTGLPYGNYVRATGILSYNDLLIIPRVETWQVTSSPSANAFRITFFLLNIGTEKITDIRVYSQWNIDLFSGANNTSIQNGFYNTTSHLFHVYGDVLPENESTRIDQYIGINASTPFTNYQVGSFDEVADNIQNETLSGTTTHSGDEGIGFGSQWRLGNLSEGAPAVNVSMTLGFGRNFTALAHGIQYTENSTVSTPLTDLCMIRPTIP